MIKLKAIQRLRTDAEFVLRGDELEWLDENQSEPTEKEIADEIAFLESDEYELELKLKEVETNRRNAYRNEADPLFLKWQRNEATEQEWLDKIAEIKERFPKPE